MNVCSCFVVAGVTVALRYLERAMIFIWWWYIIVFSVFCYLVYSTWWLSVIWYWWWWYCSLLFFHSWYLQLILVFLLILLMYSVDDTFLLILIRCCWCILVYCIVDVVIHWPWWWWLFCCWCHWYDDGDVEYVGWCRRYAVFVWFSCCCSSAYIRVTMRLFVHIAILKFVPCVTMHCCSLLFWWCSCYCHSVAVRFVWCWWSVGVTIPLRCILPLLRCLIVRSVLLPSFFLFRHCRHTTLLVPFTDALPLVLYATAAYVLLLPLPLPFIAGVVLPFACVWCRRAFAFLRVVDYLHCSFCLPPCYIVRSFCSPGAIDYCVPFCRCVVRSRCSCPRSFRYWIAVLWVFTLFCWIVRCYVSPFTACAFCSRWLFSVSVPPVCSYRSAFVLLCCYCCVVLRYNSFVPVVVWIPGEYVRFCSDADSFCCSGYDSYWCLFAVPVLFSFVIVVVAVTFHSAIDASLWYHCSACDLRFGDYHCLRCCGVFLLLLIVMVAVLCILLWYLRGWLHFSFAFCVRYAAASLPPLLPVPRCVCVAVLLRVCCRCRLIALRSAVLLLCTLVAVRLIPVLCISPPAFLVISASGICRAFRYRSAAFAFCCCTDRSGAYITVCSRRLTLLCHAVCVTVVGACWRCVYYVRPGSACIYCSVFAIPFDSAVLPLYPLPVDVTALIAVWRSCCRSGSEHSVIVACVSLLLLPCWICSAVPFACTTRFWIWILVALTTGWFYRSGCCLRFAALLLITTMVRCLLPCRFTLRSGLFWIACCWFVPCYELHMPACCTLVPLQRVGWFGYIVVRPHSTLRVWMVGATCCTVHLLRFVNCLRLLLPVLVDAFQCRSGFCHCRYSCCQHYRSIVQYCLRSFRCSVRVLGLRSFVRCFVRCVVRWFCRCPYRVGARCSALPSLLVVLTLRCLRVAALYTALLPGSRLPLLRCGGSDTFRSAYLPLRYRCVVRYLLFAITVVHRLLALIVRCACVMVRCCWTFVTAVVLYDTIRLFWSDVTVVGYFLRYVVLLRCRMLFMPWVWCWWVDSIWCRCSLRGWMMMIRYIWYYSSVLYDMYCYSILISYLFLWWCCYSDDIIVRYVLFCCYDDDIYWWWWWYSDDTLVAIIYYDMSVYWWWLFCIDMSLFWYSYCDDDGEVTWWWYSLMEEVFFDIWCTKWWSWYYDDVRDILMMTI